MDNMFNPNLAFDPNNPNGFDYQQQQQKLLLQQALAQRMNQPLDQGRMVSGWYVAPSKTAAWTNAIQQVASGALGVKTAQDQIELDAADKQAATAARKAYADASDPGNYVGKAQEAFPVPQAQYLHRDPAAVGPPAEGAAQTFQVASGAVPPIPQSGGPFQPNTPGTPTWASQAPIGPAQPAPDAEPKPYDGGGFNVTPPSSADVAAAQSNQIKYLRREMTADRDNALDRLSRTKSGAKLADAIIARDFAPAEWDFQKVKVGDNESLVAVNKRDPTQMRTIMGAPVDGAPSIAAQRLQLEKDKFDYEKSQKQGDKNIAAQGAANTLDAVRAETMELFTPDKSGKTAFDKASGPLSRVSTAITAATGYVTDAAEARQKIEGVQAKAVSAYLSELRASGMSPSALANTEGEVKRAVAARFNVDPTKQTVPEMQRQTELFLNYLADQKRQALSQMSGGSGAPPAAGATRLQW